MDTTIGQAILYAAHFAQQHPTFTTCAGIALFVLGCFMYADYKLSKQY